MKKEELKKIKKQWIKENIEIIPYCFDKGNDMCDSCGFRFCDKCPENPKDGVNYLRTIC